MLYVSHKWLKTLILQAALGLLIYVAGASGAFAASCSADVGALNFGNVDTLAGLASDGTAEVSITCSDVSSTATAVTVCANLGTGSGGATASGIRTMLSGTNVLDYQLYTDSGHGNRWGSYDATALGQPQTILLTASDGAASGTATLYGVVSASQTSAATGTYLSTFTTADATFYYQEGSSLDCTAPTSATLAETSFTTQATVAANCLITVEDIDFGIQGVIDTAVTATGGVDVTCTPNTKYTIAMDGGLTGATDPEQRLMHSGTNTITYGLYADADHTTPWSASGSGLVTGTGAGTVQSIPVYGRVAPQSAAAGQYSDTVVVTITYQ